MTVVERRGRGILRCSTSTTDKRLSSRRRGCIHIDHPVSYAPQGIGGFPCPRGWVSNRERGERVMTYIWAWGVALEEGLDGFVLFIELGKIGDEIFDDVGMG